MKRIVLFIAISMACSQLFAQITTLSDAEMGISPEFGIPSADFKESNAMGFGGSLKFAYNITEHYAVTCQAGMMSFPGKETEITDGTVTIKQRANDINIIPVKAGLRYTIGGGMYVEPQLGYSYDMQVTAGGDYINNSAFVYAINGGYHTLPGIDVGVRYEKHNFNNTSFSFVGLRVAYTFTFRRQEIY